MRILVCLLCFAFTLLLSCGGRPEQVKKPVLAQYSETNGLVGASLKQIPPLLKKTHGQLKKIMFLRELKKTLFRLQDQPNIIPDLLRLDLEQILGYKNLAKHSNLYNRVDREQFMYLVNIKIIKHHRKLLLRTNEYKLNKQNEYELNKRILDYLEDEAKKVYEAKKYNPEYYIWNILRAQVAVDEHHWMLDDIGYNDGLYGNFVPRLRGVLLRQVEKGVSEVDGSILRDRIVKEYRNMDFNYRAINPAEHIKVMLEHSHKFLPIPDFDGLFGEFTWTDAFKRGFLVMGVPTQRMRADFILMTPTGYTLHDFFHSGRILKTIDKLSFNPDAYRKKLKNYLKIDPRKFEALWYKMGHEHNFAMLEYSRIIHELRRKYRQGTDNTRLNRELFKEYYQKALAVQEKNIFYFEKDLLKEMTVEVLRTLENLKNPNDFKELGFHEDTVKFFVDVNSSKVRGSQQAVERLPQETLALVKKDVVKFMTNLSRILEESRTK